MREASAPASVQRYELGTQIAKGGMGEVYRARAFGAHGFSKEVAIKRILPHLVHPEFEQRFIAEAKLAARLTHANIVSVIDFGREGDALFIAMEYVDGIDLSTLLAERLKADAPIPLSAAAHIGIGLCTGLDFAHDQGVLHRDVSPANVLLSTSGEVKIADFGLAKATAGGGPTRANRVMGKWRYMSPEQSRAEDLDSRSDLFAAAIVIHELFTGRPLFVGRNPEVVIRKIRDGAVTPASASRPDLPPEFDAVLARALQVERDDRYPSGEEMARALTEVCYATGLIHTAKDVANLVRETAGRSLVSETAPPTPERVPTAATDMELSEVDEDPGATRTFIRSGIDDRGLSQWNATTTFHTTAEVSPMPHVVAPRKSRLLWPALAGISAAVAIGALAIAQSSSDNTAASQPDAAVIAEADPIDGSLVIEDDPVDAAAPIAVDAAPTPPDRRRRRARAAPADRAAGHQLTGRRGGHSRRQDAGQDAAAKATRVPRRSRPAQDRPARSPAGRAARRPRPIGARSTVRSSRSPGGSTSASRRAGRRSTTRTRTRAIPRCAAWCYRTGATSSGWSTRRRGCARP